MAERKKRHLAETIATLTAEAGLAAIAFLFGRNGESIIDEANSIADDAFADGPERERDLHALSQDRLHAQGCGCRSCQQAYQSGLKRYAGKYPRTYRSL